MDLSVMNNPQKCRNRQLVITDEELLTGRRETPLEMAGGEGDTLDWDTETDYSWNRKLPHRKYSVTNFIFKIRFHFNYIHLCKC